MIYSLYVCQTYTPWSSYPPFGIAGAFRAIDDTQCVPHLPADLPKHEDNAPVDLPSLSSDISHAPSKLRRRHPPKCLPNCVCRCHHPSVTRLVPNLLASVVGQVSVSKRLLRPTFSPWSLCNVQTCRGDIQRAATVRWVLPFRILHGFLESSKPCPIHFAVGAPRTVPRDSPIVNAITNGNLQAVRNLFATGKASVWDYDMNGLPLIAVS